MIDFFEELRISLINDNTDRNRKMWAQHIADENINLFELLEQLIKDKIASERYLWVIGDISETNPKLVFRHLGELFHFQKKIHIRGFDRSLAKWFMNCGIPQNIEGEVTDQLFGWLSDNSKEVSVKNYSMTALLTLSKKYPEIKGELKRILVQHITEQKVSFVKRAQKIISELEK